jgi:TRAP-type C4-dicarboxylate transport system substrate-binding protein
MSRFVSTALSAALMLVAAVVQCAAQPKPVTWDFVLNAGLMHPVAVMEKEFVDEVKKRTNGQLDIVLRPPGELPYKLPEYLRVVGKGNVQMGDVYMGFLGGELGHGHLVTCGAEEGVECPSFRGAC